MFTPLQKIIPKTIKSFGIKRQVEAALICEKYRKLAPRLVRSNALKHTLPKFYRGKTLVIGVENSAWAEQVLSKKKELMEVINTEMGLQSIVDIKTHIMV